MLDTTQLGNFALVVMEQLKEEFEDGKIRSVGLIVEVDSGEKPTKWRVFCDDDRHWVAQVVLEMGLGQLEVDGEAFVLGSDDD